MKLLKIKRPAVFGVGRSRRTLNQTYLAGAYTVRANDEFPDVIFVDVFMASENNKVENIALRLKLAEFEQVYAAAGDIVDLTAY